MLMAFWEIQLLTREINSLERQVMETTNRLSKYQKYSSRLGSSSVMSMANIAGLSPELLPRAQTFAMYSNQASSMSAMQNLQMMKAMGQVPWMGNQMMQYQFEMSAFSKFKEEALKQMKEQEVQVLNEKEKEIQLELNELETALKVKRARLESVKQLASEEARNSAPKFGLG